MIKTVHEGLNASTLKFVTFRVSTKLTKDFTMFVNVPRSLKIIFEGLMCKTNSKNHVTKDQGPKRKHYKEFLWIRRPRRPAWEPLSGPRDPASIRNSQISDFGSVL